MNYINNKLLTLFLLVFVASDAAAVDKVPSYAQLNYDVVYVRCPSAIEPVKRPGDNSDLLNWNGVNDIWLSASNNIYQQPGCDLVLHHSDPNYEGGLPPGDRAREEVLVDCDENDQSGPICSVVDPNVSFDGKSIVYTKFTDTRSFAASSGMWGDAGWAYTKHRQSMMEIFPTGDGPGGLYAKRTGGVSMPYSAPALIFRYDLQTKEETQISPEPAFYSGRAFPNKPSDWSGDIPVMDTGPFFLPSGKIGFTSNRADGFYKFQLFVMDQNGDNLKLIGHRAMDQQLHPAVLKDGRIVYTSKDVMLQKADNNNYSLFTVNPDGSNPFIFAGKQDATLFSYHFVTQLSDGDVVVALYYNRNNHGLGSLLRFPVDPPGPDFQHLAGSLVDSYPFTPGAWRPGNSIIPFARPGQYALTPFASEGDVQAQLLTSPDYWLHPVDGRTVKMGGKFSHPSGAPDNDLLVTYAIGGSSTMHHDDFFNLEKTKTRIGKNAGIWLIPLEPGGSKQVNHIADDALLVVDQPDYHEIMPRAVVPYSAIYGVTAPVSVPPMKNNGLQDARIASGEPFGLTGAATLIDRESASLNGTPWNAVDGGGFMSGRTYLNLAANGGDLAIYENKDIYGVRVVLPIPTLPYGYWGGVEDWAGNAQKHHMRILGEFPVRKEDGSLIDGQGNPDTSFVLKIPADTPFLFQAIDKYGMALNIETTSRTVARGEQQFCGGCHVHTRESLDPFQSVAKLDISAQFGDFSGASAPLFSEIDVNGKPVVRSASSIYPDLPGINSRKSFAVDWENGIKQIFQNRCASCHGKAKPAYSSTGLLLEASDEAYKKIAKSRYQCCSASRWMALNSAKSSMLVWALYGERLDGRNPLTGLPDARAGVEESGLLVDPYGEDRPEVWASVSEHAGYVADMPESERRLIARWIDIGAPKVNIHDDLVRPVLTLTPVSNSGKIESVKVGLWDDSGVDYAKFVVKHNGSVILSGLDVSGKPNVVSVSLPVSITEANAKNHIFQFEVWDKPDRANSLIDPGVNAANKTLKVVTGAELLYMAGVENNSAPEYTGVSFEAYSNQKVSVIPVVNDPDVGDSHFYSLLSQPANGNASIENNRLVYQSYAGFTGQDSFRYVAKDLSGASVEGVATVSVVEKLNRAPSLQALSLTGYQNQVLLGTPVVLDPDVGDSYTLSVVSQGDNGVAVVSGNNVEFTPNPDFNGTDIFTIRVVDAGGLSATAVVNVTVELLPDDSGGNVAPTDVSAKLVGYSGQTIRTLPFFLDANLEDSHVLSIVVEPSNGVASVEGDLLVYVSNDGFVGTDRFVFRVTDSGGLWSEGIASVTVNAFEVEQQQAVELDSEVDADTTNLVSDGEDTSNSSLRLDEGLGQKKSFVSASSYREALFMICLLVLVRCCSFSRKSL